MNNLQKKRIKTVKIIEQPDLETVYLHFQIRLL